MKTSRHYMAKLVGLVLLLSSAVQLSAQSLDNLGFGVAVGFRWNVLKPDLVDDASVDSTGIVRVNKRVNTSAGFWLESHYYAKRWKNDRVGLGPFVAAQPGTDKIITAIGFGLMAGWKIGDNVKVTTTDAKGQTVDLEKPPRTGWGIGFGYAALPSAQVLGNEFIENKPAPLGPDQKPLPIRFQQRDKGSVLGILSFTF